MVTQRSRAFKLVIHDAHPRIPSSWSCLACHSSCSCIRNVTIQRCRVNASHELRAFRAWYYVPLAVSRQYRGVIRVGSRGVRVGGSDHEERSPAELHRRAVVEGGDGDESAQNDGARSREILEYVVLCPGARSCMQRCVGRCWLGQVAPWIRAWLHATMRGSLLARPGRSMDMRVVAK